jgi:hypothetical protein
MWQEGGLEEEGEGRKRGWGNLSNWHVEEDCAMGKGTFYISVPPASNSARGRTIFPRSLGTRHVPQSS